MARRAATTRGLTDIPSKYLSPPLVVQLSSRAQRSDGDGDSNLGRPDGDRLTAGLLGQGRTGGSQDDIAGRLRWRSVSQWDEHVIAGMVVAFLFIFVASWARLYTFRSGIMSNTCGWHCCAFRWLREARRILPLGWRHAAGGLPGLQRVHRPHLHGHHP